MGTTTRIEQTRDLVIGMAREQGMLEDHVRVKAGALTPSQAIGNPVRQDYPIITGKEVIVEAQFRGCYGQAFTDQPREFEGSVYDILQLALDNSTNRTILLATVNALTNYMNISDRVRHCKNEEPESCAAEMAKYLLNRFGKIKIGLVGYQPAILEQLIKTFDADHVVCTDLNKANINSNRYGATIWDGSTETPKLVKWCQLALVTSSTLSNGTFDDIEQLTLQQDKKLIMFGITGAGVAALTGIERLCYFGH